MERNFLNSDLDQLFPEVPGNYTTTGKAAFDEFKKYAENLFKGDQQVFTKDEILAAFMEGASVAQRLIASRDCGERC